MQKYPNNDFDFYLAKILKDPVRKRRFDEFGRQLEAAYSLLQMRKKKKMSQTVLAKKLGTTQSNVARMEAGNQNFSLKTLVKIAEVFEKTLEINFK